MQDQHATVNPKTSVKGFKYGGASVKDAAAGKNVASILKRYSGEKSVVVGSAMGKITNKLEELHKDRFHKQNYKQILEEVKAFHIAIGNELFGADSDSFNQVYDLFEALEDRLLSPCSNDFDMEYDQVVSYG